MPLRVCVFCGSHAGRRPAYAESARMMGQCLVERGMELITGGGRVGLMGEVADAVLEAGGTASGIIPQFLLDREIGHTGMTNLHVVETMHERKALMARLSDAFVALPGGLGTLDEFAEIFTWSQVGLHAKPIGLLNVNGYFDPLVAFIDHATNEGFVTRASRRHLHVIDTPQAMLKALITAYETSAPRK